MWYLIKHNLGFFEVREHSGKTERLIRYTDGYRLMRVGNAPEDWQFLIERSGHTLIKTYVQKPNVDNVLDDIVELLI